jgi:DNA-binding beta-propeller fold protein YncE
VADTFHNLIARIPPGGGTMVTLAGSGSVGSDNATGTLASFYLPYGVAVDNSSLPSAGTVYVADTYNHLIRKITAPGGVVTTLAGSGTPGFADGTGSSAMFNHPEDLAVDPATGNVYVADTYNQVIRMIVPATGAVTTLVGVGQVGDTGTGILPVTLPAALPASLAFPFGIAVAPGLTFSGTNPAGSLLVTVADGILATPF